MTGPSGEHPGDLYTGALLRLTAATEHLGRLDAREAAHYQEITNRLREIAESTATITAREDVLASTLAEQACILASLEGIEKRVAALTRQYATASGDGEDDSGGRGPGPHPGPSPPWWRMTSDPALEQQVRDLQRGEARTETGWPGLAGDLAKDIRRLRDWASKVYVPGYGHLTAALGPCWDQHPLCLYTLDWLSELWQVLYLTQRRTAATLAGQAEFQTRLLPAAAAQMQAETSTCTLHAPRAPRPRPGARRDPGAPS